MCRSVFGVISCNHKHALSAAITVTNRLRKESCNQKERMRKGLFRESNPGPLAP